MKYESNILERLIKTYGVVGNPKYVSEIIKQFIIQGKECYPNLFTYQADWLAHIDEFGLNPSYTVSYTGQSIYAPNTLERPVKSAILKGNTLVNLMDNDKNDFLFTLSGSGVWVYQYLNLTQDLKPNTLYTFICKVNNSTSNYPFNIGGKDGNAFPTNYLTDLTNGVYKKTLMTYSDSSNKTMNKLFLQFQDSITGSVEITDFILIEGDYTNVDIPYFEGIQSVQMSVLKTTGKNLINILEKGYISNIGNNMDDNPELYTRTGFIKLKKDKQYIFSNNGNIRKFHLFLYDLNKNFIEKIGMANTYTPQSDCFIRLFQMDNISNALYQVEENSVVTTYEPFKSNILTVDGEYGSVGGVEDIVDLTTGKATIKTRQTTVTSENVKYNWSNDTHTCFYISQNDMIKGYGETVKSNLFPSGSINEVGSKELVTSDGANNIMFSILNARLSSTDLTGVIKFLEANELNVRYLLATESIKTVELIIKDQNNQVVNHLTSFEGGTHFDTSSQTGSVLPTLEVVVVVDLEETLKMCSTEGNTM